MSLIRVAYRIVGILPKWLYREENVSLTKL